MKRQTPITLCATLFVSANCFGTVTYLSCDLQAQSEHPAQHFDFTLDDTSATVSYYVKDANATNRDAAVFTPNEVNFGFNTQYVEVERRISRTDLTFTQNTTVGAITSQQVGKCSVVKKPSTKF